MMKRRILLGTALVLSFIGGPGLLGSESLAARYSDGQQPNMFIKRFDNDGDGRVSREEFMQHFDELDTNGDGFIEASEAPKGSPRPPGGMTGDFIRDFDRDGDGRVSREELPGPDKAFNRLDTNQDGYIDASEAPRRPGM